MTERWAAAAQASEMCRAHLTRHPEMANVPIQSVYEWLIEIGDAGHAAGVRETWRAASEVALAHVEPMAAADTGMMWRTLMAERIAAALAQRAEGREG